MLNPIIRGWANYHMHGVSKDTLSRVDNIIWESLRRWGERRHPNKGARWVIDRYFRAARDDRMVFSHGQMINNHFVEINFSWLRTYPSNAT
ncbi:group II intron maturase-specific domain-containing protein [Pseudomaricurvus alkylphenolicus]|uniref:group II intron maturase-specific domain-containing protein n=1 Tax=Pseudomaricurvus alkylphenolicus TaxID=1306991 RepID=UPI003B82FFE1